MNQLCVETPGKGQISRVRALHVQTESIGYRLSDHEILKIGNRKSANRKLEIPNIWQVFLSVSHEKQKTLQWKFED